MVFFFLAFFMFLVLTLSVQYSTSRPPKHCNIDHRHISIIRTSRFDWMLSFCAIAIKRMGRSVSVLNPKLNSTDDQCKKMPNLIRC